MGTSICKLRLQVERRAVSIPFPRTVGSRACSNSFARGGAIMSTIMRSTVCHALIGYDKDERGIVCGKPRCEEAGRRALCLEHWQALQRKCVLRQTRVDSLS